MKKDFSHLIDKNKYQVFLFKSKVSLPFIFAMHPWFVLNKKGELSRWEVIFSESYPKQHWGHLYKNLYPFFQGIELIPHDKHYFFEADLLGVVQDEEATKMIDFIEASSSSYPYCKIYKLLGPNSNTYAEWVIKNFPQSKLKLPKNAYGKNYDK